MKAPARRMVPKPTAVTSASGRFRSDSMTAAAEQYAAALARPAADTTILRGMDAVLMDLAASLQVLEGGVSTLGKTFEANMPAERALHDALSVLATQLRRVGTEAELIQLEQKRRNAKDWERIDNPRPNERGYDWQANQQ